MKVIDSIDELNIDGASAVAIGKFDGVHLGHRAILDRLIEKKNEGLISIVFTFNPSPSVFFGLSDDKLLTTDYEKRLLLEKLGIDYLIEFPFNMKNAGMEPEVFISDILVNRLKASYIIAGEDMSFGKGGKGNIDLLQSLSTQYGYEANKIEKISVDGVIISSTKVRQMISEGAVSKANKMIGQAYSVTGTVSGGRKLGRTIGFPTVNLIPDDNKLLPPNGVYYSVAVIDDKRYNSISNIGIKPTVSEDDKLTLETHIYNFDGNLYGKEITVELLEFRRGEQRFGSIDELANTVHRDMQAGLAYFEGI